MLLYLITSEWCKRGGMYIIQGVMSQGNPTISRVYSQGFNKLKIPVPEHRHLGALSCDGQTSGSSGCEQHRPGRKCG
jgi:hypothetical protein